MQPAGRYLDPYRHGDPLRQNETGKGMKIKNNLLAVSAATVLGLAFLLSGCSASPHEASGEAAGLSDASVGDIVVEVKCRFYGRFSTFRRYHDQESRITICA